MLGLASVTCWGDLHNGYREIKGGDTRIEDNQDDSIYVSRPLLPNHAIDSITIIWFTIYMEIADFLTMVARSAKRGRARPFLYREKQIELQP
jgi:hypothetical protein